MSERVWRTALMPAGLALAGLAGLWLGLALPQGAAALLLPGGNWSVQVVVAFVLMLAPIVVAGRVFVGGTRRA